MAERSKNLRQDLILAGIDEINAHGVTNFSVRRVATACNVSCAAPYKHFTDKRDFIAAIIEYVNVQWRERQNEVLEAYNGDLRKQIVENCVNYVRFLMEKPYYRSILMLKDDQFNNIYHKTRGHPNSRSQQLEAEYFISSDLDLTTMRRKLHVVRALLFGTVFMYDTGEVEYNEETLENLRFAIDREFDLP